MFKSFSPKSHPDLGIVPCFSQVFPNNMDFAMGFSMFSSDLPMDFPSTTSPPRAPSQVVRAAVKQNGSALIFASGELRNDRGVVSEAENMADFMVIFW